MAEAIAGKCSRVSLLWRFLTKSEARDVQNKLRYWLPLLKGLDARKIKELSLHELEICIRDLVFRLEDLLGTFFQDEVQPRRSRSMKDKFNKFNRLFDYLKFFQMVLVKIEELVAWTTIKKELLENLNIIVVPKTEEEEERSGIHVENREPIRYHNTVFQRERPTAEMEKQFMPVHYVMLNSGDSSRRAIGIYGMGGIGKTTLVKKLFADYSVKNHFSCCAWLSMSQGFEKEAILGSLFKQINPSKVESGVGAEELYNHVHECLKSRRYLIVLDDLCSMSAWDFLDGFFPEDQNGSRILFTTRSSVVATYVTRDANDMFPRTAFLGFPVRDNLFKYHIYDEVLEVCKGLPSAIDAVGSILATKHTSREWEMVLQYTKSLLSRGLPDDKVLLELSNSALRFNDLPYHLKPCFLYLGLFPKDFKIEVEHLSLLWMAEGIISLDCQSNETIMDIAERYLGELVERGMVKVEEETTSLRKYKSCWVHENMQDHCLWKGEEYFFKVMDFGLCSQTRANFSSFLSIRKCARRIALHLRNQNDGSVADDYGNEIDNHLRSLLLLNLHDHLINWRSPQRLSDLRKFKMLRVLTFECIDFQKKGLPKGLTMLIYLRYLSFKGCNLKFLPSSIGHLSFLEGLDLRVSNKIIIPNVLWKMEKLGYLYLPLMFQTPTNGTLGLGSLNELMILENFNPRVCSLVDLFEMTKLRHLSMTVEGTAEGILEDFKQIVSCLEVVSRVKRDLILSIKVRNFDCYGEERHLVFRNLLECQILHTLHMDGHLKELPPHYKITSSMTVMVLIGSQLEEDPMITLGKLPNLQVLVLQDNAYIGKKMNCSESSFMELKHLELSTLHFLENWDVGSRAMPKLSNLKMRRCNCLQIESVLNRLKGRHPPVTFEDDIKCTRI